MHERFILERRGDDWLYLVDTEQTFTPVTIDFIDPYYRARGGTEYLPKTLRGMTGAHVADATAGWARDAWLLAYRGFTVTLIERHPLLFALLEQGIARARADRHIADVAARLSVVHADSREYLRGNAFDAVYLDPMYPVRDKKSKVKKDMQILHALLADIPGHHEELLASARSAAKARVIVKRPQGAPFLADAAPSYQIHAPNTRFDIYQTSENS
ncbi:MAG: class I SAM-dependent methyltransferase [Cardiobacteriaceae bacterium]|nr:class I SAM-dependent methyltransferase [Cardiobacteriaceae bacterium]